MFNKDIYKLFGFISLFIITTLITDIIILVKESPYNECSDLYYWSIIWILPFLLTILSYTLIYVYNFFRAIEEKKLLNMFYTVNILSSLVFLSIWIWGYYLYFNQSDYCENYYIENHKNNFNWFMVTVNGMLVCLSILFLSLLYDLVKTLYKKYKKRQMDAHDHYIQYINNLESHIFVNDSKTSDTSL